MSKHPGETVQTGSDELQVLLGFLGKLRLFVLLLAFEALAFDLASLLSSFYRTRYPVSNLLEIAFAAESLLGVLIFP